jgi:hypothetical protein
MTLTRLLEIDRALLTFDESRGLALAELLWNRAGRPAETGALCRALENILGACQSEGLRYPPILLRRKKELERAAWAPQANEAEPEAAAGEPACTLCGGTGSIPNPGGLSGRLCECFIRKHSQSRNAGLTRA